MTAMYIILYLLTQAGIGCFIALIGFNVSPVIVLLAISIINTLFFLTLKRRSINKIIAAFKIRPLLFFNLFLYTGLSWVFVYCGTILGSPGLQLILMILTGAIVASIYQKKYLKFLGGLILMVLFYLFSSEANIYALIFGVLSGITAYLYQKQSNVLSNTYDIDVMEILAIRFIPFIFILFFVSLFKFNIEDIRIDYILPVLLISVLIIIPAFLSQKCINLLKENKFSYMSSFLPIVTFSMQDSLGIAHNNIQIYILVIITPIFMAHEKIIKKLKL